MTQPLKIGLLVDSDTIPHWAAVIVERINAGNYANVTLVVKNSLPGEPVKLRDSANSESGSIHAFLLKIKRNWSRLGYIAFGIIDSSAKRQQNYFESPRTIAELVPDAVTIDVRPEKQTFSDFIVNEDIAKIREADVDILFRLGFRILRGDILKAAKYGIWSYHHGDNRKMRGGPSGFWELVSGAPTVGVILQILNEDLDGGLVLSRSWHLPDILLLNRQRHNVFMQALSHFPRQVERLHRLGETRYFERIEKMNQHPDFYSQRLFLAPNNRLAALSVGRHYLRYLSKKVVQLFFFDQWILLSRQSRSNQMALSMWRFKKHLPPRDRMWADPFVMRRDDKTYVFVEEMVYSRGIGHISVMELDERGELSKPTRIIEQPYHMSYPFLLEYEGELYMVPETAGNKTVDLYRCTEFPYKWEYVKSLMSDIFAVDATLFEHDGRWWMFATVRECNDTNCLDELHLYYADSPLSTDWVAHPQNPLSCDVRNARPAGNVFKNDDRLYRPAQDGGVRYGYGMKINHIQKLTVDEYLEETVSDIKPNWDWSINATHTLNHLNGVTVSDASQRRFRYFRDSIVDAENPDSDSSNSVTKTASQAES